MRKQFIGEIKEYDDNEMIIKHTITSLVVDRDGEVLIPKGCITKNYKNNPVVAFAHNYYTPAVGKNLGLEVNDNNIVAVTQFAETALGRELYYLYKNKFMSAWSIGFVPVKASDKKILEGQRGRTYEEWELLEYSAVVVPSNPEALTLAVQKGLEITEVQKIIQKPEPEVTDEYIRIRVKDPELFVEDSFRTITISEDKGIKAVIGKYKSDPDGPTHIQAYLFDKDKWTVSEAEQWVEEHEGEKAMEKSGRIISEANREKIREALVLLKKCQEALEELLEISEPPTTQPLGWDGDKIKEALLRIIEKYKF